MSRPSPIGLAEISDLATVGAALGRARRGRRAGPLSLADPIRFCNDLAAALREGRAPVGDFARFTVYDPKKREILAPSFADRVAHHAIFAHVGPVLEKGLVADTYACRPGKGTLAAVRRAQTFCQRYPFFVKVDMAAYFASIDHVTLLALLHRRFSNPGLRALFARLLAQSPTLRPGRGLPIGVLSSQHFANLYLDGLDRYLGETLRVAGLVRYMDDVVWWCTSMEAARESLAAVELWVARERHLSLKVSPQIGRSRAGLPFLGFVVTPGRLGLLRRRRRRFRAALARWESAFVSGRIHAAQLQAGVQAALAITHHADAGAFRQGLLAGRVVLDV
jgi:hypothetical protein